MKLSDIPQLKGMQVTDKSNVKESKLSILVLGDAKAGKTHFWCTMPEPIICLHMDKNTETADGFIRAGKDIQLLMPPSAQGGTLIEDWKFFADVFVPLARNRQFDCRTLVVEGYNYLAESLVAQHRIKVMMKEYGVQMEAVPIPGWALVLNSHNDKLNILKSVTVPDPGGVKPSYNLVVTCHLIEQGDEGNKKFVPAIQGAFQSGFAKLFGSAFIVKSVAKTGIIGNPPLLQVIGIERMMYTVPPSEKYSCGDGIGGKDRKVLPPVIENTYQALCAGWGVEEEK